MSNLQARLASALVLSVAASAGLMAVPNGAARADSCISEPKGESPQGKHWHYRIERGTGRHCWYLRGEKEASARPPAAEHVAAAKPAPAVASGAAPSPHALADAHAEFAPKVAREDNSAAPSGSVWPDPPAVAAPAPATTADSSGVNAPATPADSQLTSRWPQASGAPSPINATPQAQPTVADAQAAETATTTATVSSAPPQASAPPTREVGSLQKLALVAFGALALAGITGSLVYRLAGARWGRRQERWPRQQPAFPSLSDEARAAPWVAPETSSTVPHQDVGEEDHPELGHVETVADRIDAGGNNDSFERIEDFLARLTKQLQNEAQTPHAAELENPRPR